jgi:DNA polymerase III subunit epsilon
MRQIVLDTETTGLEPELGHRIIEIGCVEIVNRRPTGRTFHHYLNPDRDIDKGALEVHGITLEELQGKPRFADVVDELMAFICGAELIIHNAAFDVAFLDAELKRHAAKVPSYAGRHIAAECRVLDSLALARQMHPGQRNNLDALCKRYSIDNSHRELHGALLDSRILADVYLAMTGGQVGLALGELTAAQAAAQNGGQVRALVRPAVPLIVVTASADELKLHEGMLATIAKASKGKCLWQALDVADIAGSQSLSSA